MALNLRHTVTVGNCKARIYRDTEWNEFRVTFEVMGRPLGPMANYHTDDFEDARMTAEHICKVKADHES